MDRKVLIIGDEAFSEKVRAQISPLGIECIHEIEQHNIETICTREDVRVIIFDDDSYYSHRRDIREPILQILRNSNKPFIIISSKKEISAILNAKKEGASDFIIKPYNYREFIARFNAVIESKTRISCVGGGTGLFHVLLGLKDIPNILLTSIVSMSDEGGSSGKLRASFGILPPGDIRRSLVALSDAPEIMNQVMQYRFQKGEGLSGHSFGNLFVTALADIKGSVPEAVKTLGDLLNVRGIVLPVTHQPARLCAEFEDGTIVKGEDKIDACEGRDCNMRIKKVWHEPEPVCNIDAFCSIIFSDIVIVGPGDLFTSVVTNLLVKGISEAVMTTQAKKIYICNLMTKPGETGNYLAEDHIREIIKYMKSDHLDYVLISNTKLSENSMGEYAKKNQVPVVLGNINEIANITKAHILISDIGHETELVRHDSQRIAREIKHIIDSI